MMDFWHCPVSQNPNAALLGTKRESVAMAAGGSALKKSVSERQIGQSLSSGWQRRCYRRTRRIEIETESEKIIYFFDSEMLHRPSTHSSQKLWSYFCEKSDANAEAAWTFLRCALCGGVISIYKISAGNRMQSGLLRNTQKLWKMPSSSTLPARSCRPSVAATVGRKASGIRSEMSRNHEKKPKWYHGKQADTSILGAMGPSLKKYLSDIVFFLGDEAEKADVLWMLVIWGQW